MNVIHQLRSVLSRRILVMFGLNLVCGMSWAQTNNAPAQQPVPAMVGAENPEAPAAYNPDSDRMMPPPPVNGLIYPIAVGSQVRSNYLRTTMSFTSAYTDNVLGGAGQPVSDITYTVTPMIGLDATTTRTHLLLNYAPGYTFYQRTSARNEADQNVSIDFSDRISPHVTFSARDIFTKSSNVFNQSADLTGGVVSGGIQTPNFSVIAPFASFLKNSADVGMNYQFGLNDMIGASGSFSNLHFLDEAQVPGLADSSSQGALGFYSHRVGREQYLGVTYSFQRLLSYPTVGDNETLTHAVLLFYSYTPTSSKLSISFFGGPQYSDTTLPSPYEPVRSWGGSGGTSLGWQAKQTSFAVSYAHIISGGGGLGGAVQEDTGSISVRQQITKRLDASVMGTYVQNNVVAGTQLGVPDGHSVSGSASLHQAIGEHLNVRLEYARVHQSYSNIPVIAAAPDTNRGSVSIDYQFSRPLGR